jgi:hypothetical protein
LIEIDPCTSLSLVAEDGCEVTITMRRDGNGAVFVSLYMDDGANVSTIDIPRFAFDQFIAEMRTLQ